MKILIFTAVWCPGCIVMERTWEQVNKKYKNIEIIKYDSEENDQDFDNYDIGDTLPVTIFINKNNNELERLIGEKSYKTIEQTITKYI